MSAEFNPNNLLAASPAQPSDMADTDDLMWELLSLYVDGEASPEESAQVEQMLRHDAEYARAYTFMQQTSSVVHTIAEIEPPAFLRDAILAKTSQRLTFAKRLSASLATLRTQMALPPMGRLALAGGSMAACALLIGVYTAQPANNSANSPVVVSNTAQPAQAIPHSPARPADINPQPETGKVPQSAVARATAKPETITSKPEIKVDFKGLRPEPPISSMLTEADKTKIATAFSNKVSGTFFTVKAPKGETTADIKPPRKTAPQPIVPSRPGEDSGASYTQNVSPMMDAGVQHRQPPMTQVAMRTDDDLDRDVVANTGDTSSAAMPAVATADTDAPPKGTIVGKLQLSKLPPTARHIQTAADIQRIQEARNMGYTASVMEGMQRRESDLSVISGKF